MGCNGSNKINNTCGAKVFAPCVYYELALPMFTTLLESRCYTLEEIVTDMYSLIGDVLNQIDLEGLTTNGIEYILEDGKLYTKEVLRKHAELIKDLEKTVTEVLTGFDGNIDITSWELDTSCLVDPCNLDIVNMKQLSQLIIDKLCELDERILTLEI